MKDLIGAIAEEKLYVADRMKQINTSLIDRLKPFGYETLEEYFDEKGDFLLNGWKPEVFRIDIEEFAEAVEDAIINGKYGIYIPVAKGFYAYHGTDSIDRELCKKLNVKVVDLNYNGGTIIGSSEDLSIEIVAPSELGIAKNKINEKISKILGNHMEGVEINGNDILVDGKKIMGSMTRQVKNTFVWAAQISFGEYDSFIKQICSKISSKIPGRIQKEILSRDKLESEVLQWLR